MNNYLKLAWRNLWRNKRRTLITVASIFFGVIMAAFMSSMQEGSYAQYIRTVVFSYSGYIQIHKNGYWNDKTINNSLCIDSIKDDINSTSKITVSTARLENFALASAGNLTKGVLVMGIVPEEEDKITSLSKKIIKGSHLTNTGDGVVIGSGLATYLHLQVNDTLILLGQGYHGTSAAGKYPISGIVKQPSPQLDRSIVYMNLTSCQELFSAQGRATALVLMVENETNVKPVLKSLKHRLNPTSYETMDWEEINRILMKQIESDRQSNGITKGVLYMIIAFGIMGTIIMMTMERRREFGILIAIGMQKTKLMLLIWLEVLILTSLGVVSGILGALPVNWYFTLNPIPFTGQAAQVMEQMGFEPYMSFSVTPSVFYDQALIIFILTLLIGLYPIVSIKHLKIHTAIHS